MKKRIKNISLSFPCQENWNGMSPTENGRHCSSCNSCVIDFRNKSADELENTLITASAPVCGRFNKSQLSSSFLKYAASAAVIASASLTVPAMGQDNQKIDSLSQTSEDAFFGMIEEMPKHINGTAEFYEQIVRNIRVPNDLKIKTKVYVEFVVDTLGNMTEIKVVKGDSEKLNAEALRVLGVLKPRFIPGTLQGKKVPFKMAFPILFYPKED